MRSDRQQNRGSRRFAAIRRGLAWNTILALACVTAAYAAPPGKQDAKKLSRYTAIVVEAFTVQQSAATKDFPIGLESALQSDAVSKLRAASLFDAVINAAPAPAAESGEVAPLDLRVNAAQPIAPNSAAVAAQ